MPTIFFLDKGKVKLAARKIDNPSNQHSDGHGGNSIHFYFAKRYGEVKFKKNWRNESIV